MECFSTKKISEETTVNPRLSAAVLIQNSAFLMLHLTEGGSYSRAALIQKQKVSDKKIDRMHGVQDNIALEYLQNIIIRRKIINSRRKPKSRRKHGEDTAR